MKNAGSPARALDTSAALSSTIHGGEEGCPIDSDGGVGSGGGKEGEDKIRKGDRGIAGKELGSKGGHGEPSRSRSMIGRDEWLLGSDIGRSEQRRKRAKATTDGGGSVEVSFSSRYPGSTDKRMCKVGP